MAFRNLDHLSNVINKLNISNINNDLVLIQDQMLRDQKLEPSEINRTILAYGTWAPWEIYLCLLHAEVEYYKAISEKEPRLIYKPIQIFIERNDSILQSLRLLRNKILHPKNKKRYQDSILKFVQLSQEVYKIHYHAILHLQDLLDNYLGWMQKLFKDSHEEQIGQFDLEETLCWFLFLIRRMKTEINGIKDEEQKERLETDLAELEKIRDEIIKDMVTISYVPIISKSDEKFPVLEMCMTTLSLPLPKRPYLQEKNPIQTPLSSDYFVPLFSPSQKGITLKGTSLLRRLQNSKTSYVHLIMTSLVFSYECFSFIDIERYKNTSHEKHLLHRKMKKDPFMFNFREKVPTTALQMEEQVSSLRIACALLSEPVRVYKHIAHKSPSTRTEEIEKLIDTETVNTLKEFRNMIFHVPVDPKRALLEIDSNMAQKMIHLKGSTVELATALLKFYTSIA